MIRQTRRPELVEGPFFRHAPQMAFWVYMLHCYGGRFYVGHTDNLERRLSDHQSGQIKGFTSDRLPVTLVWSEQFSTRMDAKEMEHRLKGWSRAKKMALIRGDWDQISALSKGKAVHRQAQPERSVEK